MADARCHPQIVQRGEDGLTKEAEVTESAQGEEALINPVEVQHIRPLHPWMVAHVEAPARCRDAEEASAVAAIT